MNPDYSFGTKTPLTRKQKQLWAAGIVAVLLYFNPGILRYVMGAFTPSPKTVPIVRPVPPPAPTAAQVAAAAAAAAEAQEAALFTGKWYGRTIIKDRGNCQLSLEARPQPTPLGHFMGYTNLICLNMDLPSTRKLSPFEITKTMSEKLTPASTVLSGDLGSNALTYHTEKVVATDQANCNMQSLDATPFGTGKIAVQWKDTCGGGEMTLGKTAP